MASYTRQSTFSDGDLIAAALFNDEYNQLVSAFNNTSGHKHDGTVGEGPVISILGDGGLVTPLNKILVDTTNDHIEFWIDVSGTSTQQLYIADGAIVPVTDNDIDLGTNSLQFKDLYINGTANIDNLAADSATLTTADINGGNIDGTVIGATTAAAGTFTTIDASGNVVISGNLTVSGTTTSVNSNEVNIGDNIIVLNSDETGTPSQNAGIEIERGTSTNVSLLWNESNDYWTFGSNDLNFPDNSKAIFGTGSDLRIYHDGSDSYIQDLGSGDLRLRGTQLKLEAASGERFLEGIENGLVRIYYDNSVKLATTSTGIDVTGTATMDGLTLGANDKIQFGTSDITGIYRTNSGSDFTMQHWGNLSMLIDSDNNDSGTRQFMIGRNSQDASTATKIALFSESGDISFYEDTGTTAKLFWDSSAESLGIGTTSPSTTLHLATTNPRIMLTDTDTNADSTISAGSGAGSLFISADINNESAGSILGFNIDGSEKARIDTSGNVLVGKTSASQDNTVGTEIKPTRIISVSDGIATLVLNRKTSDGAILSLKKNNVQVGSIGSYSGLLTIGHGDVGLVFSEGGDSILPINQTANTLRDNAIDLGDATRRFKDLYLAGNAYIDGDITISGTTTSINTTNLNVEDKNIILNYGSGNTSSNADGAGITIQDAVDASTDATILWNAANDRFDFSHAIDVTGTATMDGLTVEGLSLVSETTAFSTTANSSNVSLKIGNTDTTSGSGNYKGALGFTRGDSNQVRSAIVGKQTASSANVQGLAFLVHPNSVAGSLTEALLIKANNDIAFYDTTGSTEGFFWDASAESLGIGTTSPDNTLMVQGASTTGASSTGNVALFEGPSGTNGLKIFIDDTENAAGLQTIASDDLLLNPHGGNVGIGTSSPSYNLSIEQDSPTLQLKTTNTTGTNIILFSDSSSNFVGNIKYNHTDNALSFSTTSTANERMRIDANGNVGIGTSSPNAKLTLQNGLQRINSTDGSSDARILFSMVDGSNTPSSWIGIPNWNKDGFYIFGPTANGNESAAFYTGANWVFQTGGTERVRIDSSGNFLVGTTSSANTTDGVRITSGGYITIAQDAASVPTLFLNKITNDGQFIQFQKDGSEVGSIATKDDNLYLGTGDTFVRFFDTDDAIAPVTSAGSTRDNAIDLGTSTRRFKDLHLSGTANFGNLSDGTTTITGFVDEDNMASNSATLVPTQQSVKAYVDSQVSSAGGTGISFADNEKAKFGDGLDLEIYHDGNTSYILDDGDGDLQLRSNNRIVIAKSPFEYMADFNVDGAVDLYYDNSKKLATTSSGINVIGTVTSDGLTVDGSINKNSNYNITQFFKADGSTRLAYILFRDDNPNFFEYNDTATQPLYFINNNKKVLGLESNSDISFYDDTGTTQGLFWDASAESLFIGATSASALNSFSDDLIISNTTSGTGAGISIISNATNGYSSIHFGDTDDADIGRIQYNNTNNKMTFRTNTSDAITIDSSQNVGIGTSSPATNRRLHVVGAPVKNAKFESTSSVSNIEFSDSTTTVEPSLGSTGNNLTFYTNFQEKARINQNGNFGIGTSSPSTALHVNSGTTDTVATFQSSDQFADIKLQDSGGSSFIRQSNGSLIFEADRDNAVSGSALIFKIDGSNVGRFTSDGRLGIGTTAPSATLEVAKGSEGDYLIVGGDNSSNGRALVFTSSTATSNGALHTIRAQSGNGEIAFSTGTSEALRIDSSQNIGIGTSSPADELHVNGSGDTTVRVTTSSTSLEPKLVFVDGSGDYASLEKVNRDIKIKAFNTDVAYFTNSGNVGIGTTSPTEKLNVIGNAELGSSNNLYLNNGGYDGAGTHAAIKWFSTGSAKRKAADIITAQADSFARSDLLFRTQSGTSNADPTEVMRITHDNNVGIGETSPQNPLHVRSDSASGENYAIQIDNNNTTTGSQIGMLFRSRVGNTNTDFSIRGIANGTDDMDLTFNSDGGSERLRITKDGNVGIGTSSPSTKAHIVGSSVSGTSYDSNDMLTLENNGFSALNIVASPATASTLIFSDDTRAVGYIQYNHGGNYMRFNSNGSERARIDSSGNLLVGTTTNNVGSEGVVLRERGDVRAVRSGGTAGVFNRLTSDGGVVSFQKDGSTIGSIGTLSNRLCIGTDDVGLFFDSSASNAVEPFNVSTNSSSDNLIDLGSSSTRFKDLYLSGTANVGEITASSTAFTSINIDSSRTSGNIGGVNFRDSTDTIKGQIYGLVDGQVKINHNSNVTTFDASGNLLVGQTSQSPNTVGVSLNNNGNISAKRDGGIVALFNRATSDGEIISIRKDDVTVGSIGVDNSDNLVIEGNSTHSGFQFGTDTILPHKNGALISSTINLGNSGNKFKDLHLSGTGYIANAQLEGSAPQLSFKMTSTGNTNLFAKVETENSNEASFNILGTPSYGGTATETFSTSYTTTKFFSNGSERARIDSNGALLVGKTTDSFSVAGATLNSGGTAGKVQFVRSGEQPLALNRLTNNGVILGLYQGGTEAGRVGSYAGLLYLGKGDTTLLFDDANDHIVPRGTDGGARDNVINLGSSSNRFNDLYLGGTVNGNKIHLVNNATDDTVLLESTEDSSSAAPVLTFKRNSSSVADADYLGQLKFKGENDADQEVVYAKITAKISDASDGTEDGLIEFANKKAGSNVITARLTSETFKLLNGTDLEVNGSITADGNITAYSDERLKDNIKTLNGSKVLDMRGVSYVKDGKKGSGVIAQEIEKIAPELVHTAKDEMGTKSVAYGNLVGYLIEAIKDQQEQINELKGKLNDITG